MRSAIPVRGYLLHITHYDPVWCQRKAQETPFHLPSGLAVVDALTDAGFNLLLVDVKDGVGYRTHPELRRHYTQPMDVLRRLCEHATARGLETAIKLNFSQSGTHRHNHWFAPHHDLFDNEEYWRRGFQCVDELIEAARPRRFFHIGMDEDHDRSVRQYLAAIEILRGGLFKRSLRPLIWNDSACHWPQAEVHREKSLAAEACAGRDFTHVIWDYSETPDRGAFLRARDRGLTVWGAPGAAPDRVAGMLRLLQDVGGEGLLVTRWTPCVEATRDGLVGQIGSLAPILKTGG